MCGLFCRMLCICSMFFVPGILLVVVFVLDYLLVFVVLVFCIFCFCIFLLACYRGVVCRCGLGFLVLLLVCLLVVHVFVVVFVVYV